jgi:hypothetical protein
MYIGWKLDPHCRDTLLERFPPRYSKVVADGVTLLGNVTGDLPVPVNDAQIVGRVDDGEGVEAMIVSLYGSTDRFDGSCFHIPWSVDTDRAPTEASKIIEQVGWSEVKRTSVRLHPARW